MALRPRGRHLLLGAALLTAFACSDDGAATDGNPDVAAASDVVQDAALGDAAGLDAGTQAVDADAAEALDAAADAADEDVESGDDALPADTGDGLGPSDVDVGDATDASSADSDDAQTDAEIDAGIDAGDGGGGAPDSKSDAGGTCSTTTAFDYACDAAKPSTCPGGICAFNFCIGPKLDADRWKDCGDGVCGPCETAAGCPADCGTAPTLSGAKVYDGAKTITVWVHGFTNKKPDEVKKMTYGAVKGCGDLLENLALFGVKRPCGSGADVEKSPQHMVAVEYYGGVAPAWMTPQDIADVEAYPYDQGAKGLERYARIVAKFARWRMQISGATHVQFACHSMGCLITRHLVERDLEQLASKQQIVRWASNTGVIAGARLARLYDNPAIQQGATAIGLELSDFVLMNPDHVMDVTAAWDHKLYEANNPLFQGIWMHHSVATNPKIQQALGIQLLDLNNPGDEPNDGIMYALDQYFWSQKASGVSKTSKGVALPSTRSYAYFDHMANPESLAAAVVSAAALFHGRKVRVVLEELELYDDLEADGPFDLKNQGPPPAEVAFEVAVRYDPWLKATYGKDVLVSEQRVAHRSAEVLVAEQGKVLKPEWVLYAGPVFDAQPSISLDLLLLEADWYPRFGVAEWPLDIHELLLAVKEVVPLKDHTFEAKNKLARAVIRVEIHEIP